MPRLLLVRHATSVLPAPGGPDEHERPLSALGRRQAEALVEVLVPLGPVRVLSSPYLRAVQTVAPTAVALGLAVETRDSLAEWRSGIGATPDWESHYRDCWGRPHWCLPGAETHAALEQRALTALAAVHAETPRADAVVLGLHGTWIARALHGSGCDVDADFWLDMPMPTVLEVDLDETPALRRVLHPLPQADS